MPPKVLKSDIVAGFLLLGASFAGGTQVGKDSSLTQPWHFNHAKVKGADAELLGCSAHQHEDALKPSAAALDAEPSILLQTNRRLRQQTGTAEAEEAIFPPKINDSPLLLQDRTANVNLRSTYDFGLSADVWSGADVWTSQVLDSVGHRQTDEHVYSGKQSVKIMGLYNSGTNLLSELLRKNFPGNVSVLKMDAFAPGPYVSPPHAVPVNCTFWKHSSLTYLKNQFASTLAACGPKQVLGLAMVRNPMSWLSSCKHVMYELDNCRHGDDWLRRACTTANSSGFGGQTYDNVEAIWSAWMHDYNSLKDFGFERSLVIKYEDLVMDTEGQLAKIAEQLGVDLGGAVQQIYDEARPWAAVKEGGRARAIAKIENKSYLNDFSGEEFADACTRLDRNLLWQFGHGDCDRLFEVWSN